MYEVKIKKNNNKTKQLRFSSPAVCPDRKQSRFSDVGIVFNQAAESSGEIPHVTGWKNRNEFFLMYSSSTGLKLDKVLQKTELMKEKSDEAAILESQSCLFF